MKNLHLFLGFLLLLAFAWPVTAVQAEDRPTVRLAYTAWSSSIASAHVVQAVLQEELGYPVELLRLEVEEMWQAVADGRADAGTLTSWRISAPTWREPASAWWCRTSVSAARQVLSAADRDPISRWKALRT